MTQTLPQITEVIRHDLTPHLRGTTTYPAGWSPRRSPGSPDLMPYDVPLTELLSEPEPAPEPVDIDLDVAGTAPEPRHRRPFVHWGRHRPPVPLWFLGLLFGALAMVAGAIGGGLIVAAAIVKAGGTW